MSQHMNRRQVLKALSILAALPAAGGLAACSTGTAPASAGDGGGSAGTKALEFWTRETQDNGARQPRIIERLAAFDAERGTTITPQFLVFQESVQKTQAALAAGNPPDVGQQGPDVSLGFASAGNLLAIDDVFAGLEDRYSELQKDAFVVYEDKTYGVPWYLETRVLFYHKDLLEQAGVEPPTTWDEWLAVAQATTRGEDQFGFLFGPEGPQPGQLLIPLATAAGAPLLDAQGQISADTAGHRQALQLLKDMFDAGAIPKAFPTYKNNDVTQLFAQKKAAMYWANGEVLLALQSIDPTLGDNIGAVLTPVPRAGDVSRSFLGGFELFAFAGTQSPDDAKALISYMFDAQWYGDYIKATNGAALPVTKELAADPFFSSDPHRKVLVEQLATAVRYGGPEFGNVPYLGEAEGKGLFSKAVLDVFTGAQTVDSALSILDGELKVIAGQAQ
ncbi:ABC transporter substrate-binding protein [Nakamurella deserti]|uniref:ABC transporter substrate-binding protein n=1 Tax=Nakamurella deserti TaxID=2164074 RepID=UPI001300290C|nr:sugar ABC transporter substrate-binding protein [Nakamurella deserti]